MKREELLRHLRRNGCRLLCEGAEHSWWQHAAQNKRSAIPRHSEIEDHLARKICRDLGVSKVK
ncbi:MAG: addiction module toxin, HicA family [Acidobacteria bacterium]|nr:addiction module toxin, HicA family [Acidobacteriota bacterium]